MKIRVQQSDLFVAMMEALGANPTPMPYSKVYTGAQDRDRGRRPNNWPSYESSRHFEAAKYYNVTEHSWCPKCWCFRSGSATGCPKDDRALVRKPPRSRCLTCASSGTSARPSRGRWRRPAGRRSSPIADKKPFVDAMTPVYGKFANTPKLQDLVKRLQAKPATRRARAPPPPPTRRLPYPPPPTSMKDAELAPELHLHELHEPAHAGLLTRINAPIARAGMILSAGGLLVDRRDRLLPGVRSLRPRRLDRRGPRVLPSCWCST